MDGLEFTEKLIGHVVALLVGYAWPVVVVVFLVHQREALSKLIDRIKTFKAGKDGVSVDIGDKLLDVKENVAEAKTELPAVVGVVQAAQAPNVAEAHGEVRELEAPEFVHKDLKRRNWLHMADIYKNAPPVVIHNAWMEVRGALYKVLGLEKTAVDWWSLDGMPDEQLVGRVKRQGKLGESLLKAVTELMVIHGDAVSTIGWQPNQAQVFDYVQSAGEVVDIIMDALGADK